MGLRLRNSLECSINMMGGATGATYTYMPPRDNLAATSSRPNLETPVVCEVLAHPHMALHPGTCGLLGGAAVVATTLISYVGARSLLG
jgi:hypothetical protein